MKKTKQLVLCAILISCRYKSLIIVAVGACAAVFIVEMALTFIPV